VAGGSSTPAASSTRWTLKVREDEEPEPDSDADDDAEEDDDGDVKIDYQDGKIVVLDERLQVQHAVTVDLDGFLHDPDGEPVTDRRGRQVVLVKERQAEGSIRFKVDEHRFKVDEHRFMVDQSGMREIDEEAGA
jgi:hypothetical protein